MLKTGGVKILTFGSFANPVKGCHIQISPCYPISCDFHVSTSWRLEKRFFCQGKGAD